MSLFFDNVFNPHNWAMVPFHFWSVVIFWFGCIVGSFLNVCIYRMPLNLSVVSPPSHCPHCKYAIPFYLNVPLLTWLVLQGRCKNCAAPISPRYFIVELLTGVAFLGCWLAFGAHSPGVALAYCLFLAGLIVATFIDFEHFIIPDEITLGGTAVGLVISLLLPSLHGVSSLGESLIQSGLGIGIGWGLVYGVLNLGKLLFGSYAIEFDPQSRVVFTETAIVFPPKRLPLEPLLPPVGWFGFQASRIELVDRCHLNVPVAVSATQVILHTAAGPETFARAALPHLEVIFDRQLSSRETARLAGVPWNPLGGFLNWLRELGRSLMHLPKSEIRRGSWLVFTASEAWLHRDDLRFETDDVFHRESDAIRCQAREIRTDFGCWRDTPMTLTPKKLTIGGAEYHPEAVAMMEVVTDRMVMPREAMGEGDVKFMAAIGAFTGWQGVLFSLMVSSLIGSVVGITLIAARRREWSSRMPYGPYIALAAVIWVFFGHQFVAGLFRP